MPRSAATLDIKTDRALAFDLADPVSQSVAEFARIHTNTQSIRAASEFSANSATRNDFTAVATYHHARFTYPSAFLQFGMIQPASHASPGSLTFDNRFTRELPADVQTENHTRQVSAACYSRVLPTPVAAPKLIAWSREVAELLGMSHEFVQSEEFAQVFGGNQLLPGMDPFAMCYGGHQFGSWAGQLGDGRAINLGELVNPRSERWTLQLKGAGRTPYSRTADGLAVLRSSVREFLCSEAMYHLGVPTTRALSLVTTGEQVRRDMFYDGNPQLEPGAIVCRVAPSFVRFGNFEIFTARRDFDTLRRLADFTIRADFAHLGFSDTAGPLPAEAYVTWFHEVCQQTADLLVHWMRVGFVHGVMNTDNMSILGLTIDYGPYGWLEDYDPNWTPNTTDAHGRRYRYEQQPRVALWNLAQLANAIYPLIEQVEPLQTALDGCMQRYEAGWRAMMAQKLGLAKFEEQSDEPLANDLLAILQSVETDMTIFFRNLALVDFAGAASPASSGQIPEPLVDAYYVPSQLTPEYRARLDEWLQRYGDRLRADGVSPDKRRRTMNAVNPKYVLRNYLAQLAIDKAESGDPSLVSELLDVLRRPYDDQPGKDEFAEKRPDWARHRAGCSMLSCSS